MSEAPHPSVAVITLLASAEAALATPNGPELTVPVGAADRIAQLLREVEQATPRGASLHAQLDTVRKWVAVLSQPADLDRFGGPGRVRDHVAMQFRLARAAAEDYFAATG